MKEFPELPFFELPPYGISYPKNGKFINWHFLLKSPGILKAIITERRKIAVIIPSENIKGMISDNRLGAYSQEIPSVYMTHQLQVFAGPNSFFSSKIHHFFKEKNTEVWVPDVPGENNLSGAMSHNISLKVPIKFMGIYSRFTKIRLPKK